MNKNFFYDDYVAWRERRMAGSPYLIERLYGKDALCQIMAMQDEIDARFAPPPKKTKAR